MKKCPLRFIFCLSAIFMVGTSLQNYATKQADQSVKMAINARKKAETDTNPMITGVRADFGRLQEKIT